MMRFAFLFVAIFFSIFTFSQSSKVRLDSALSQRQRGLFLTAFETLTKDTKPNAETLPMITSLLVDWSIKTNDGLTQWTMADKAGDKIIRSRPVVFNLESILMDEVYRAKNDCRLQTALNQYYTFLFTKRYLEPGKMNLDGIASARKAMQPAGCADEYYYFIQGYAANGQGSYQDAIEILKKGGSKIFRYGPTALEMGRAYYELNDMKEAEACGQYAFKLLNDNFLKSRAALLLGNVYLVEGDKQKAGQYLQMADSLYPNELSTQKALLNYNFKNNPSRVEALAADFLKSQGLDKLPAYVDLLETYSMNKSVPKFVALMEKLLPEAQGHKGKLACINFAMGVALRPSDASKAKQYFQKARNLGLTATYYQIVENNPRMVKLIESAYQTLDD